MRNGTVAATQLVQLTPSAYWAAYDSLPARLRKALQEALLDYSPVRAADRLARGEGEGSLLDALERAERWELRLFAAERWPGPGPYPHLAAGAFILRYHGDGKRA